MRNSQVKTCYYASRAPSMQLLCIVQCHCLYLKAQRLSQSLFSYLAWKHLNSNPVKHSVEH